MSSDDTIAIGDTWAFHNPYTEALVEDIHDGLASILIGNRQELVTLEYLAKHADKIKGDQDDQAEKGN